MKIVAAVLVRRISHVFESEHFLADGEAGQMVKQDSDLKRSVYVRLEH